MNQPKNSSNNSFQGITHFLQNMKILQRTRFLFSKKLHRMFQSLYSKSSRDWSLQDSANKMFTQITPTNTKKRVKMPGEVTEIEQKLEKCLEQKPEKHPNSEKIVEIKQGLEKCLELKCNRLYTDENHEFWLELADLEDKSVEEVKEAFQKEASKNFKKLFDFLGNWRSYAKIDKLVNSIEFLRLLGDIVSQNWKYLTPELKEVFINIYDNPYNEETSHQKRITWIDWIGFIITLLSACVLTRRNLLVELEDVTEYFVTSLQTVMQDEEENRLDWECVIAARESAITEGTISWEDFRRELGEKYDGGEEV